MPRKYTRRTNTTSTFTPSNTPTCKCPDCGKVMVKKTGTMRRPPYRPYSFWTCTSYPACRGTRDGSYDPVKAIANAAAATVLTFIPTAEQVLIWDEIQNGTDSVIVQARAGTGKSTTARISMYRVDPAKSIYYGCFGNRNVADFAEKGHPDQAYVATHSAYGYRQIKAAFGNPRVNKYKTYDIVDLLYPSDAPGIDKDFHNAVKFSIVKLVGLVKSYLADASDIAALAEICALHGVDFESEEHKGTVMLLLPKVMEMCKNMQSGHGIDFDDMLWLPVVLAMPCQQYDIVYLDEAQDANTCQHALLLRMLKPGGRAVIIGDDYQAIFGFRGSDTDSIANLGDAIEKQTVKPCKVLKLSICQRCPALVIELAQTWVPDIMPRENAPKGNIYSVDIKQAFPFFKPGDMVICRVNAPLMGIALGLIKMGVKAVVLGRDVEDQLKNLIKRFKASSIPELLARVDKWTSEETAKFANSRNAEQIAQRMQDNADCVHALAEDAQNIDEILAKITNLFADEKEGKPNHAVVCSSVHKAKGLEAKTVHWIFPHLTCKGAQEQQIQQEKNLKYVAVTRSMDTLFLVHATGKGDPRYPAPPALAEEVAKAQQLLDKATKRRELQEVAVAGAGEQEPEEIY